MLYLTMRLFAVGTFLVAFLFSYGPGTLRMSLPAALVVSAAAATAVWLSGRRPRVAFAVATAMALGLPLIRSTFQALDLVIVLIAFQVARRGALPPRALAVVTFVDLTVNDAWQRVAFGRDFMEPSVLYPTLLTMLAVGAGMLAHRVTRQNERLWAMRDVDRLHAVSQERRRIGRDLHDVAAHHISALVVRNRLALRSATPQAWQAAAQFTADTAAQALDSMRQVVHVLATEDQPPHAPQPTLAELDEVFRRMTEAGLTIEHATASGLAVRRDVEVAVVRIVQESLANVLRHRGPGRCWVELRECEPDISLTVEDDGPSEPPYGRPLETPESDAPGGYGLLGMHERAAACGGRLTVDGSPRGGWRVSAVLPGTRP